MLSVGSHLRLSNRRKVELGRAHGRVFRANQAVRGKQGMALQAWGLIVGQPEAGVIISEWSQVAVPTASGSSTISVTAPCTPQTVQTFTLTISGTQAMVWGDPPCLKHPSFERVPRPDSGSIPGLENLRHPSPFSPHMAPCGELWGGF